MKTIQAVLAGLLVAGVCLPQPASAQYAPAQPYYGVPGYAPPADNPTAGREHCEQLRQALQETEQRRQFGAPPWEIQRLENRYHQIRERLQVECGIFDYPAPCS